MPDRLRVGVLGAGAWARAAHLPGWQRDPRCEVVALADTLRERAEAMAAELSIAEATDDWQRLVTRTDIDVVDVVTPSHTHYELATAALEAGKHVLCEKPLAVTAEQGVTIVQTARDTSRLLMEAFMYRFHPQTLWALEQVAAGRIGPVKLVRASFAFNVGARSHDIRLQAALAGGSLMDVGCYPVNLCRAIYGRTPIAVGARVFVPSNGEVEQATTAVLDFDDGCFGLIDSNLRLSTRQTAEIIGETGTITIPVPFTPGHIETVVIVSVEGQTIHQRFAPIDQYRLEVEHFANCIRFGHDIALSLEESVENQATIEAIYQSAGYTWPIAG